MKITEFPTDYLELPESFSSSEEYEKYAVKRIRELKEENRRLIACLNEIVISISKCILIIQENE